MEGTIYTAGALVFGFAYTFIKPLLETPWLIAVAVAYFGLLRLAAQYAAKRAMRRAIASADGKRK